MTEPLLIGLVGRARVGKDTSAEHLQNHGFLAASFADPLKNMLEAAFGPHFRDGDREKPLDWLGKSPRELMQTLGTEWGRDCVHRDLWVLLANERWQKFWRLPQGASELSNPYAGMVFTDVRFENEAGWITSRGGWLIEITRKDVQLVSAHRSESADLSDLCDFHIGNDHTVLHLHKRLDEVLAVIKGRGV